MSQLELISKNSPLLITPLFLILPLFNFQQSMKQPKLAVTIAKLFLLCLIFYSTDAILCKEGVPVLTRVSINNTSQLKYQCLCPVDYFGPGCRQHRGIKCYLTKKSMNPSEINESNYAEAFNIEMEVNAQCYIEQKPAKTKIIQGKDQIVSSYIPLLAFLVKRRDLQANLDYELESGESGGEIIWANDTNLFYENGRLKQVKGYDFILDEQNRKVMSPKDEAKFLKSYAPSKFQYKSNFLGFPVTDSKFYITSKIIRPTQNSIFFAKKQLHFANYQEYTKLINQTKTKPQISKFEELLKDFTVDDLLNQNLLEKVKTKLKETEDNIKDISQSKLLPYFKQPLTINPQQAAELENIRIQVALVQNYFLDLQIQKLSTNGVQFILPTHVPGLAQAKVYSVNFNKKQISRIVYFLVFAGLAGLAFLIYTLKNKKHKKRLNQIKRHVQEMQDAIPWK